MRQVAHPHNPTMQLSAPTRWLWFVALFVALALAVVGVVALIDDNESASTQSSPAQVGAQPQPGPVRYDGGPNEGVALVSSRSQPQPGVVRYDGGPNEGSAGLASGAVSVPQPGAARYDGGPNEGMSGVSSAR